MKVKNDRLEALRMIISSQELGSQDELLEALKKAHREDLIGTGPKCLIRPRKKAPQKASPQKPAAQKRRR